MSDDMGWTRRRTGLEVIDKAECWLRLAEHALGRIGVLSGKEPLVFPVNYAVDGETLVFRTGAGTKFHAMVRGAPISLEIDGFDETYHSGWSVLAVGRAREVDDPAERDALDARIRLRPWATGDKSHWMVLQPDRVTGRRLGGPAF